MPDRWNVKNGVLTLSRDTGDCVLDASEIYSAMISNSVSSNIDSALLTQQLPELRFSKMTRISDLSFELFVGDRQ